MTSRHDIIYGKETPPVNNIDLTHESTNASLDNHSERNLVAHKESGEGAPRNDSETMTRLLEAAIQGDASAQYNIGLMYGKGRDVPQDYQKAMEWYLKAADQGYRDAQSGIRWMCLNGEGIPKDKRKAMEWYTTAAEQGDADAKKSIEKLRRELW